MFVSIQQAHGITCDGYTKPIVRTGMEGALATKTSKTFASTAKQNGVVKSITDKGIQIEYEDGSIEGFPLGLEIGTSSSISFPFELVTDLKLNAKVKLGDVISYNKEFFSKDIVANDTVVWRSAVQSTVALVETSATYEDGCSITSSLSNKLLAPIISKKDIRLDADKAIHKLVKVGDRVKIDQPLCVIEEGLTAGSDLFDEETLDALKDLQSQVPKSSVEGVVEKITVIYNAEMDEMSDSIKAIVKKADRELANECKARNKEVVTGSIVGDKFGYNHNGVKLTENELVITIHIKVNKTMGIGDKLVVSNQLKSVVSEVITNDIETESGTLVDLMFGIKSVGNRIVNSVYEIGIDSRLLVKANSRAIAAYKKPIK